MPKTSIKTQDFESFVHDVATDVWNSIIHEPAFGPLLPTHYVKLMEAIRQTLERYQAPARVKKR